MTSKIFKSMLAVAVAVILATMAIILSVFHPYFASLQQTQLRQELLLAAAGTEQLGIEYLESLKNADCRLTLVDAGGNVLFDSQANPADMENHADREEIRQALTAGAGSSIRRSATLMEETVYEAVRLADGSVLRVSVSRMTALVLMLGTLQPLCMLLLLAALLSAWLAHRMAKRVVKPLNALDLDHPLENNAYEELAPLLHRIHRQQEEIQSQMQTLKRRQEEFDQITGSMREGLVLLDTAGRILSINPAARQLFGADEACVGKDFLTLDRRQEICRCVKDAMEQGHASLHIAKNGREYQFDFSRIDSGGSVYGLVILAFDITEQVQAESHRREFTANVSHELKTPLQSIIGSAELLENGIVKPADQPQFLARIHREAARMVALIDDIIRLSQLDEGAEMPREEVSLRALADEVCQSLSDSAGEKGISLTVSGADGNLHGVRRLLYEVVYNLCDNAIKYNRPGGSVRVEVAQTAEDVTLSVQDTGIGIAPEHQEKIFERFYRVDKSHSRQSGGTGLGLSIVKHAVQYHHGTLHLDSAPGQGTTITASFPRAN